MLTNAAHQNNLIINEQQKVYLKDANMMLDFGSVYDLAFPHRPARSMIEVSKLPAGVDIQVDFMAMANRSEQANIWKYDLEI